MSERTGMDEQRPVGWHLDRPTGLFRYWDGTRYTATATAKELGQHRRDVTAVEGATFTTNAYIDGRLLSPPGPVTAKDTLGWVLLAAVALALVWFVVSLIKGPTISEHDAAIREVLRHHGAGIESITQEGGTSHATINTDLNALDPLDMAGAQGMCLLLDAERIPGLLGVTVESSGGLEMASCTFVDRE